MLFRRLAAFSDGATLDDIEAVVGDDQLDQWYAANPPALPDRPAEAAIVHPDNPFVLTAQAGRAAHERAGARERAPPTRPSAQPHR